MTRRRSGSVARSNPRRAATVEPLLRALQPAVCSPIERRFGLDRVLSRALGRAPSAIRCGRFTILDKLGEGGMGIVYRARDPHLHREVAVKVLRPTLASHAADVLRREARAMASINHPHVVPVYQIGVDEAQLWVAMELVDGPSLAVWALEHPVHDPPTRERALDLLRHAARGLEALHAIGLVHRDVKPSNILVGDDGRARISDLGLAHSIAHDTGDDVTRRADDSARGATRPSSFAGSLRYMAPEQQLHGDATPSTDQFALCVSAWEVLYGEPPFEGRTLDEILAAKQAGPRDPPRDRAVPARTRRVLERGLSARPVDRFATMGELADALGSRRQARSARALHLGLAAVGLLGLGLASAGRADGRCAEGRARQELSGSADPDTIAQLRAALGHAPPDVTRDVVASLDTFATAWTRTYVAACEATWGGETTERGELDARMGCLRETLYTVRSLADHLLAEGSTSVGDASIAFERLPDPERCMNASDTLEHTSAGSPLEEDLRRRLAHAEALHMLGDHLQAAAAADTIASDADRTGLEVLRARALERAGASLLARKRHDEAIERLHRGYDLAAARRDGWRVAASLALHLAQAQSARADNEAAREWVRHARAALGRGRPDPVDLASVEVVECSIHVSSSAYPAAEASCEAALRELHGLEGLEAERRRWQARVQLAVSLREQGDVAGAEVRFQTLHDEIAERLGPGHPLVGPLVESLAATAFAAGSAKRAAGFHRRAVDLYSGTQPPDDPALVEAYVGLGSMLWVSGDLEGGGAALEEAIARGRARGGAAFLAALGNLGLVRRDQGRVDEAIGLFQQTLDHADELGGESLRVASIHQALGSTMQQAERFEDAERHLRDALRIRERAGAHGLVATSTLTLARLAQARGQIAAALERYFEALAILDEHAPHYYPEIVDATGTIATLLVDRGRYEEAVPYGRRALEALEHIDGKYQAQSRVRAHYDLARAHEALAHGAETRKHARSAAAHLAEVADGLVMLDRHDLAWIVERAR